MSDKRRESSIAGMSVQVMRKNLAELRSAFAKQPPEAPFCLDTVLSCEMPAHEFCYKVSMGVHKKSSRKVKGPTLMKPSES